MGYGNFFVRKDGGKMSASCLIKIVEEDGGIVKSFSDILNFFRLFFKKPQF